MPWDDGKPDEARRHGSVRDLVHTYLERHPAERIGLAPLLASLDAADDPADRTTEPGHLTYGTVVIDRDRRVLHVRHTDGAVTLPPGARVEPGDRTLLGAALREAAGIRPGDLCLTPQLLGSPVDISVHDVGVHDVDADPARDESAHRHYDVRFALYLARGNSETTVRDEGAPETEWRPFDQISSPTLRAKLLDSALDGRPEPVNASVLISDDSGRYLLHLRDHYPHIWEPGAFALLGGGREPEDASLEATIRRELAEEVPGLRLPHLAPFAVEEAIGVDGMCVPVQIFTARWNGDPDALTLHEGVLLRWFPPEMLHRLRLNPSTAELLGRHAAQHPPQDGPPKSPAAGGHVIGVHLYLEDDEGRILLGLRHPDSAHAGAMWHFLAGHCEREPAVQCLVREALEQAGLVIDPADVEYAHTVRLLDGPAAEPRVQVVFRVRRWRGVPEVREPDKCLEWKWWRPESLPEAIVPYARWAVAQVVAGRPYSEVGW